MQAFTSMAANLHRRRVGYIAFLNISAKKPPSAPAGIATAKDKAMNHLALRFPLLTGKANRG